MTRVGLVSLGCAKNRVDAEHLLGGLAAAGFELAEDPAEAEVAVLAALDITDELFRLRDERGRMEGDASARVGAILRLLDQVVPRS